MISRRACFFAVATLFGVATAHGQGTPTMVEPPFLEKAVAAGELPPVAERIPQQLPEVERFEAEMRRQSVLDAPKDSRTHGECAV